MLKSASEPRHKQWQKAAARENGGQKGKDEQENWRRKS